MKRVCIVLAVLAVATSAFPADEYTPEADTDDVNDNLLLQATARVHSLMAEGKDDSACRTLAKSEQKTIEDAVKTQQKMLDGLPTGKKCPEAGQDGVKKAKKAKTDADKAMDLAKKASSSAENVQIDFGKRSLNSMSGACAISKKDEKYVAAMAKVDAAKKSNAKAEGAAKSAAKALVDAEKAAKKEKRDCECNVQEKQAAAWKSANKKNSNAKDYAKATNMLCVLDGKKPCPAKTCPSLKKPTVQAGNKCHQIWRAPPTLLTGGTFNGGRQFELIMLPKEKRDWATNKGSSKGIPQQNWYKKACAAVGAVPIGCGVKSGQYNPANGATTGLSHSCSETQGSNQCMGMPAEWGCTIVQESQKTVGLVKLTGFTDFGKGLVGYWSNGNWDGRWFSASLSKSNPYGKVSNGDEFSAVCGKYVGGDYVGNAWCSDTTGQCTYNGKVYPRDELGKTKTYYA